MVSPTATGRIFGPFLMARSLDARSMDLPSPVSTPLLMRQMRLARSGAVVSFDSRKTRCCIVIPVGPGALPVLSFLALFSSWAATATSLAWGASLGMLGKGPCVSS